MPKHTNKKGMTQEEITMLNGSRFKVVANNAAGRGYAGAESIYLDELREHKDYSAWSAISRTQLAAKNRNVRCGNQVIHMIIHFVPVVVHR